ncbi:MAG: hypothetical protein AMJ53_10125 [Gammaproteobacteria bacterium SG8_11]|nr:MAG: hypothetical protein AMJ53_10125 [Gammaproteobacteria bacterium SG8_11]
MVSLSYIGFSGAAAIPFDSPADKTLYGLAEQHDPAAQFLVGRKFYTGNGVQKDIHEAIKWFELAATQKHTKAQFQLGIIYLHGESGIKPNHVYALNYLREAAKSQYAEAQFELANYYLMGKSENVNYPEAVKWYRAAADQQHVRAMVALGKILNEGRGGIKPQPDEAKHLLSLAAESGNVEAMEYLREMVRNNSTTFRNAASITDFHATLNEASAGHIPSQYEIGMAYLKGNAVDADMKLAAKWIRRAAMNDHPEAQYQLSQLYRDGVGLEKNRRRALEWLKIAATAGVRDAQKELRSMYLSNSSLDETDNQTAKSNEELEDFPPLSEVIIAVTEAPEEKTNTPIAESDAQPFQTASTAKNVSIAVNPAVAEDTSGSGSAADNLGASTDVPIMDDLYSLDLTPATPEKQYELANRYFSGKNLYQDSRRAAYWYERAATQNHVEAQYQLGEMYKHGNGVTASVAKAKFWLGKAASAGSTDAQISLRDLSGIKISATPNVIKANLAMAEDNPPSEQTKSSVSNTRIEPAKASNQETITTLPESEPKPPQTVASIQANAGMISVVGKNNSATTQELDEEIQALIEAANNNEAEAQLRLADMYRKGRGVDRDPITAAHWYQKAATEGHAEAQFRLGDMYKQGTGVDKNNALAIKWYRKAANQGHTEAKHRLGGCRIC